MASGTVRIAGIGDDKDIALRPSSLSFLEAVSYSSMFWAAPLLQSWWAPAPLLDSLLFTEVACRSDSTTCEGANDDSAAAENGTAQERGNGCAKYYVLDGGVIDTTGIVPLLQRRTDSVVAFYNNNVPLSSLQSPIAYLFGDDAAADAMNGLHGPELGRAFEDGPELYPAVVANLTDPSVLRAHLRNVRVARNDFLGIEGGYVLRDLYIVGNGRPGEAFFRGMEGGEGLSADLDPRWPDGFPAGMSSLDANALCALCDWKVQHRFKEELDQIFEGGREESAGTILGHCYKELLGSLFGR